MKNKAFTLTEILIALAVIGILIAILMPIIFNLMPDRNALMAKRAYYAVQSITNSMLNDEACYPDTTQALPADRRIGFDDGYGYANCSKWGGVENTEYINKEDANKKFITLFKDKLDIKEDSKTSLLFPAVYAEEESSENNDTENNTDADTDTNTESYTTFTTKDGMVWTVKVQNMDHSYADPYIQFMIDVNGDDKPNCRTVSDDNCSGKKNLDRFTVNIHADGKIDVIEKWAQKAIETSHDITSPNTEEY